MDVLDLTEPAAWLPPGDTGELRIYPHCPITAKAARGFADECLTTCGRLDLSSRVELVLTELVTNVIKHAPSRGVLAIEFRHSPRACIFDVIDREPSLTVAIPDADDVKEIQEPGAFPVLTEDGRGLILARALAYELFSFNRPAACGEVVKVVRAAFI